MKRPLILALGLTIATFVAAAPPAAAYDRDAAANWANTYWNSRHPSFPQGFGNDCTNFASQALLAGGVRYRSPGYGWTGGTDTDNGYWYGDNTHWTYTWSLAERFFYFSGIRLAESTYQWRGAASSQPANTPAPHKKGDMVFYEWGNSDGSTPDHVNVSVGYGTDPNSPSYTGDRVSGHTTNRLRAIWHLKPYNSRFAQTSYYLVHIGDTQR